ncbi:MAG: dihydrofolate reductase, partial [Nocardioides sp.]
MTLIAAVADNGVIGDGDRIPWHLPEDFAHFKATTLGGVLIMGRATFDAIGRPLPGRTTVVVTRDPGWRYVPGVGAGAASGVAPGAPAPPTVRGAGSIEEALAQAHE